MTTDLKALADALILVARGYGLNSAHHPTRAAASILRTLADADAKMPVTAIVHFKNNGTAWSALADFDGPTPKDKERLVRQSDAQAAILAATADLRQQLKDATERAEKADALLQEARRFVVSYANRNPPWTDTFNGSTQDPNGVHALWSAIDQHLGAAK
jgi:hypothetical protein